MPFLPQGTLHLLYSVPLDTNYEATMDFSSLAEQYDYFINKTAVTIDENTYTRKDEFLKVQLNVETMNLYNYVMYQNYDTSKWIYAFITKKTYINEFNTALTLETDVLQTYAFDVHWYDSFIEREHSNRWSSPGAPIYNTLDESVTVGEEYTKEGEQVIANAGEYFLVITTDKIDTTSNEPAQAIQNTPTPFFYYLIPRAAEVGFMDAQTLCLLIADQPQIISVSYIPFLPFSDLISAWLQVCTWRSSDAAGAQTFSLRRVMRDTPGKAIIGTANKHAFHNLPTSFGTGNPRSNSNESKLLTYPYRYNMLTDLQAEPFILKNEYLDQATVEVSVTQTLSHNAKTKYFISNGYLGETTGKIHSMINSQVSDLPLKNYEYYTYMLSHKAQIVTGVAVNVAQGVAGAIGSAVTMGPIGAAVGVGSAIMSVGAGIANEIAKQKDLQNVPPSVRQWGNNIGFEMADGNTQLMFMSFRVTDNILGIAGAYFAMYGYKSSQLKVPDLRSRYYYNYIKTIGVNIDGDMDTGDLAKIKAIYNRGVTIWHNRAGVVPLNYQYDNVEMSLL